jgi:rubredoxin
MQTGFQNLSLRTNIPLVVSLSDLYPPRTDRRFKMLYVCPVCSYRYDDDFEMDPFDKLPDEWCCPVCKAVKNSFKGIHIDHSEGDG